MRTRRSEVFLRHIRQLTADQAGEDGLRVAQVDQERAGMDEIEGRLRAAFGVSGVCRAGEAGRALDAAAASEAPPPVARSRARSTRQRTYVGLAAGSIHTRFSTSAAASSTWTERT